MYGDSLEEKVSDPTFIPCRSGKKRSLVWDHFKTYEVKKLEKRLDDKGKEIMIEVIHTRAKCIYCPKGPDGDYAADSNKNGTRGMLNHITKLCKYYPANQSKFQKILASDKSHGNKMVARGFVQSDCLSACVEMIVLDELPFSFVEKMGFRRFCSVACPIFNVPSRRTLVRQFLKMHDNIKEELKKDLCNHRICLTTDTWTSLQNINYMVLTAHFIDGGWNMHKRVLNFCVIPNHQGATIGRLIESCLLEWKIEKVLTITVDNAAANKTALDWVRSKMNGWNDSKAVLKGKYLHVRCCAHITNLVVSSGLKRLNRSILAIRNSVKYVRSSPHRLEYFKQSVEKEKLSCKGLVCMDVPTRWNSTYIMLEAALKFKQAFIRMGDDPDSPFLSYFKEPDEEFDEDGNLVPTCSRRLRVGPPSEEDWDKAAVFVKFLKVFHDVTLRVSASKHPTVHTTFHDVLAMEHEIDKLFVSPELLTGSPTEKVLMDMAAHMKAKFNKYFGSYKDLNKLVVLGLVLDPRFKLRHITHLLRKEKYDEDGVQDVTKDLKGLLMSLYEAYGGNVEREKQKTDYARHISTTSVGLEHIGSGCREDILDDWRKVVQESEQAVVAHEIDQFLLDPLEFTNKEFDICLWWKLNGLKYPVLAEITKDVLAIQVSTVASESCFSTSGRVIDSFRSSLTPSSVEALICMQSWLRGDAIIHSLEDEPSIEELEFYETIEQEYKSGGRPTNT